MRMRTPKSLLAGLMWFDAQSPDALSNIRHNAQDRDGLLAALRIALPHPGLDQLSASLLPFLTGQ